MVAAATVAGAVAWSAGSASAGTVTCCSYIVSETEADGPTYAPRVTFSSGTRAADVTGRITRRHMIIRDRAARIDGGSGCVRRSPKVVSCRDGPGDAVNGRSLQLIGSEVMDRFVVAPFPDA